MDLSEDHSTDTTTTQRGNQRERGLYLRVPTQKQKTQRGYEMERETWIRVCCVSYSTQRGLETERSMRHKRHREGTRWREVWIRVCGVSQHRDTRDTERVRDGERHGSQTASTDAQHATCMGTPRGIRMDHRHREKRKMHAPTSRVYERFIPLCILQPSSKAGTKKKRRHTGE